MGLKVVFPFRSQAEQVCDEAKQMLKNAGFEVVCNETGKSLPKEDFKAMISDAYAVVAGSETYDKDVLSACKNLKVVIRFGVGTDNFDLEEMKNRGIRVGVITNFNAVAEFALTMILSTLRKLPEHDAVIRNGEWKRYPMRELSYKTVGILGFGKIGKRLAELLSGFSCKVLSYDPFMNEEEAKKRNVIPVSFDELLKESDVVSLHLPSIKETKHIINKETLAKMKDGAVLINTSRGALVDENALYESLKSGKLFAAGLDVFEKEKELLEKNNPLFGLDNISLSPHVAASTFETTYNGGIIAAKSIINVLNGDSPLYPLF